MKAKIINGKIVRGLPKYYKHWAGGFDMQPTAVHETEGFFEVVNPEIDYDIQKLGEIYWDETNRVFTYPVIDKTPEQLEQEITNRLDGLDQQVDNDAMKRLLQHYTDTLLDTPDNLTEEFIKDTASLYPVYRINKPYVVNEKFRYNDILYSVIQAHTSQADWLPDTVPALYKKFTPPNVVSEWVQPTGAQDAYNIGDKVSFSGSVYESLIDANVWSPTAYPAGWKLL